MNLDFDIQHFLFLIVLCMIAVGPFLAFGLYAYFKGDELFAIPETHNN